MAPWLGLRPCRDDGYDFDHGSAHGSDCDCDDDSDSACDSDGD